MTKEEKLGYLKHDLQRPTSAQDEYLCILLEKAEAYLTHTLGIANDGSYAFDMVVLDLASFYFRSRDREAREFDRFLQMEIRNLIDYQTIHAEGGSK